jgi:hypothetical protein
MTLHSLGSRLCGRGEHAPEPLAREEDHEAHKAHNQGVRVGLVQMPHDVDVLLIVVLGRGDPEAQQVPDLQTGNARREALDARLEALRVTFME